MTFVAWCLLLCFSLLDGSALVLLCNGDGFMLYCRMDFLIFMFLCPTWCGLMVQVLMVARLGLYAGWTVASSAGLWSMLAEPRSIVWSVVRPALGLLCIGLYELLQVNCLVLGWQIHGPWQVAYGPVLVICCWYCLNGLHCSWLYVDCSLWWLVC